MGAGREPRSASVTRRVAFVVKWPVTQVGRGIWWLAKRVGQGIWWLAKRVGQGIWWLAKRVRQGIWWLAKRVRLGIRWLNHPPLRTRVIQETAGKAARKLFRKPLGKALFVIWFFTYLAVPGSLPWILFGLEPFGPLRRTHSHPWALALLAVIIVMVLSLMLKIVLSRRFWQLEVFFSGGAEKSYRTRVQLSVFNAAMIILGFATLLGAVAATYLQLSHDSSGYFSTTLDHAKAFYFTVTTFTTTGFGDIHPKSRGCEFLVSAQMLIGLGALLTVFAGLTTRVITFTATGTSK